jgi:hypothetical protein
MLVLHVGSAAGRDSKASDYVAKLKAERRAEDESFRDKTKSPLCSVAVASLDRARTTVGSAPGADLLLPGETVAPIHAEILKEQAPDAQSPTWLLRAVGGEVRDEKTGEKIESAKLEIGRRFLVGRYAIFMRQLGTFGVVIRASDTACVAIADFKGLRYFPIDPSYRVEAEIVPDASPTRMTILDTHGWRRPAWRYGVARFEIAGKRLALALWLFTPEPKADDQFFVPFKDLTSGKGTYGVGRFLNLPFVPSGGTVIDFNEAYNPSCAYGVGFACPIPPRENTLPVEIRAGERTYSQNH